MDGETVLSNLREPVFAIGTDGEIYFVSDRFCAVTDTDRAELLGADYGIVGRFIEGEAAEFRAAVENVLDGGVEERRVEATMRHPESAPVPTRLPAELRVTPVVEDGAVTGALIVLRDISVRVERERELEVSRRRFEAVLNTPDAFIGVLDADGRVITVNAAALAIIDEGLKALVGTPFPETPWWSHSAELRADLREWIDRATDGEYVRFEANHVTPDDETVPVEGIVRPVTDDDGTVTSIIVEGHDITERKSYERELERQNERLERFAGVVSHDLRNPLNVAKGRLELASRDGDSEHLRAAARAVDRMETLVEDLLTLTREGHVEADESDVDLGALVGDCWDTVETGGGTLRVEADATVRADPNRLRQVFENLLRNSVEHGGESVTVTVGDLDGGFYVADDGPGIPAEEREGVFEAGYSTAEGGTGFGLNIVRTIADAHGWDVTVEEAPGGGARFAFRGVEEA